VTVRDDVDVVIVAHNSGELLADAVRTASQQAGKERVWVMDAESTDGSAEAIVQAFPGVHVIAVPNAGFSAGNNRGIESGSHEFVLLLNPDAELKDGAIEMLVAAARADARVGIVGPLVLGSDGLVQLGSFGRFPTLVRRVGIGLSRGWHRLLGQRDTSPRVPGVRTDVDWVTGACMLVRRTAIDDVGPMDEAFFLYYEDIEWCHRMRDHGWRVVLEPSARCVHRLGRSGAPEGAMSQAYRDSFSRYCDLYGLWGLKATARAGSAMRRALGGSA